MKRKIKSGGGWPAILYTLKKSRQVGGIWKMYRALRSKNACKTCALGMGGQRGGMVNELGHFPEVCKKSLQAMAGDMQGAIKESFWKTYSIEQLRKFSPRQLETSGRLTQPLLLRKGEQYYRPISWEEAFRRITEKLLAVSADETFFYFSGRSSNEAGFLLQLFARLYGTNNVNNCSYYCHQASGVGLTSSLGTGTATVMLEDLDRCDCVFLIGGNPSSNHPRMMTSLMNVRRRGGQVIVINPVVEVGLVNFKIPSDVRSLLFGSKIASLYIQPDIGGDLALLTGIAKRIVELQAHDQDYLSRFTNGSDDILVHLSELHWDEIEMKSGVSRADIDEVAACYAKSKRAIFSWTMGITHHDFGVQNVQAISNLALLRGMVGRPGCGLMPIRGHSNIQGIGSVGVTPQLKEAIFRNLVEKYHVQLPVTPGRDTLECIHGAESGELKVALCLGGNLYGSNPDADFAERALSNLELLVYLNTSLNTGHARGIGKETIILPVLARDEEPHSTTQESMFNFIRLSDGGSPRITGPRSEVEIIATLGEQVTHGRSSNRDESPIHWESLRKTRNIRTMIGNVVPGFEKMLTIDEDQKEFHISNRTIHQPKFPTSDGRARMHIHELPDLKRADGRIRIMTVRSEGQFNTVVYEEGDLYRGQTRRDVILLNPDDIVRLGLKGVQRVAVFNETGRLDNIGVSSFPEIKAGNALMYYPEANVLVPRLVDPLSRTPAFKGILVQIESM